jgi:hypothetical protein
MSSDDEVAFEPLRRRLMAAEMECRRCARRIATLRLLRRPIPQDVAKRKHDADAELNAARSAFLAASSKDPQTGVRRLE